MKHAVTSKRVISYRGDQGGLHYRVVQSTLSFDMLVGVDKVSDNMKLFNLAIVCFVS